MSSVDSVNCSPDQTHSKSEEKQDNSEYRETVSPNKTDLKRSENGESSQTSNLEEENVSKGSDPKISKDGCGSVIAAHYNTKEIGLAARSISRIVHLRNFNNWIKCTLIDKYVSEVRKDKRQYGYAVKVFDMCCGKGGDLFKWRSLNINHLVCADIAEVAIENCKKRYQDMKSRSHSLFSAEFIVADLTKTRIREKYYDPSIKFDVVSCQFAFHYCFESLPQAECMLRNASECLRPGGYFIGTMPDAFSIIEKQKASNSNKFGNSIYNITFEQDVINSSYPLFGSKYNFHLEGVVDCPEFLVYFPLVEKLAKKYGLKLVKKLSCPQFFEQQKLEGSFLLRRMSALETYPPQNGQLSGSEKGDYDHCKDYLEGPKKVRSVGTLSKPEWEVASIYLIFAFQKLKPSYSPERN